MRYFFPLVFSLLPFFSNGQFTYVQDQSVVVKDDQGNALPLAWAGGLNASQFNTLDINGDGVEDLVLYDRMANKVQTFLNTGFAYSYAPEYENQFPSDLENWILLRDFNCDGLKDIFSHDNFGIKVYQNTTIPGEKTSWKKFLFYVGPGIPKSSALVTKGFSSKVNLQLTFDDLPAINDADGDGDLDIFNFRFTGTGTIEFHQNFSQERYGTCDSLDFERLTQKWAGVTECNCENFAFNDEPCDISGGRVNHAVGKSLLALDANADGHVDLIVSEASCSNLSFLANGGNVFTPVVTDDVDFPEDFPVDFQIFPAAYYEDVTFDGNKDLLVAPNIYSKVYLTADLKHSSWLYQNSGSDAAPAFEFVKKDFLQEHMIDVGDNAIPAFTDIDGDSDLDMLISYHAATSGTAGIYLFENTGSLSEPQFTFMTDNYLDFRSTFFYNLKIRFGDLNGDGKQDLVFTATSTGNGETHLYYIINTGTSSVQFNLANVQMVNFEMTQPENVSIVDDDGDGNLDILIGKSNGSLQLWRNNGAMTFSLIDDAYLNYTSSVLRQSLATAIADFNADGAKDLLLGDQNGNLSIISDYKNAIDNTAAFGHIIFNPIDAHYEARRLSGRVWPAAANLFNTNKPAIVAGNILGGVTLLRHDNSLAIPNEPELEQTNVTLYPNPVARKESLFIRSNGQGVGRILNVGGQVIVENVLFSPDVPGRLPTENLASGVYIFQSIIKGKTIARRFVVF
jgi:hypothetical protein